jgi:hypothetical protein
MKTLAIGLALLLAGCAGLQSPDPASPYYAYAPGWSVQLKRPLAIEPGAATARLQYGRIVPRNGVQEHDPFCVVELDTVRETEQILQPGRFEVWRVTRSISTIAAAASPFVRAQFGIDDRSPSLLYFKTEFRLRDAAQPELRGMTCMWNQAAAGSWGWMRHLTLDEIRHALGDWMVLTPTKEAL